MHVVRPAHTTGTSVVSLADAKEFLRVDSSDEDTTITHVKYDDTTGAEQTLDTSKYYIGAATDGSMMIYFHDTPDLETYNAHPVRVTAAVGDTASANVKHAVKMLVAHWYENRRAVVTGTITATVPIAVESLLSVERIIDHRQ